MRETGGMSLMSRNASAYNDTMTKGAGGKRIPPKEEI